MKGTAPNKDVITLAPQKDICPHGSKYPKNASIIRQRYITKPNIQTNSLGFLYDPYNIALNMCKYITMKKNDAPVECMYLNNQPKGTSLIIYSTESKAPSAEGL
jgi:hypothetical protein